MVVLWERANELLASGAELRPGLPGKAAATEASHSTTGLFETFHDSSDIRRNQYLVS